MKIYKIILEIMLSEMIEIQRNDYCMILPPLFANSETESITMFTWGGGRNEQSLIEFGFCCSENYYKVFSMNNGDGYKISSTYLKPTDYSLYEWLK